MENASINRGCLKGIHPAGPQIRDYLGRLIEQYTHVVEARETDTSAWRRARKMRTACESHFVIKTILTIKQGGASFSVDNRDGGSPKILASVCSLELQQLA